MKPDDRIQSYLIIGEAGRGGMGIVYRARDESLDRDVAIKVLPEIVAFNPERMARFEREAKLLASLRHPGIALIYGLEQVAGHPEVHVPAPGSALHPAAPGEDRTTVLVMEYVEGDTLSQRIGAGPMHWRDVLPIAIQLAAAIEYAHRKGIIHRDLKPANIKFDDEENVKVLDFGLAKVMNDESSTPPMSGSDAEMETLDDIESSSRQPGSTVPGVLMGTMGYASPEQTRGKGVDKRTDIFSFGCVLFEMLSGDPPFPAESAADAIGKTLHKEPGWDALPESLPSRLKLLLRRCLAKDLKHRLCDIGDARLELSDLLESGADDETGHLAVASGGVFWKALSVFLLCLLVGVLAVTLLAPSVDEPVAFVQKAEPVVNRSIMLDERLKVWNFASAPDGSRICLIGSRPMGTETNDDAPRQVFDFYFRDRDDPELRSFHRFRGAASFDFSPDARSYYLQYPDQAYRGEIDSSIDPVSLPRLPDLLPPTAGGLLFPAKRGAIWFDETTIVTEGIGTSDAPAPELVLADARTGVEQRRVPIRMGSAGFRLDGLIDRFDDEHVLMYVSRYGDDGFSVNIATISLETGELELLVERSGDCQLVDDHLFFTRGDTLYVAEFDPVSRTMLDAGRPVQKDLYADYSVHASFEITDDGDLVYMPGGFQGSRRRLMRNDGTGPVHTGMPDGPYDNSLAVSADGSRICTTRLREDGLWEVWAGTFDPPRLRRLFHANDIDHFAPMLSHDGEQVLVGRTHNGSDGGVSYSIMLAPFDGSEPGRLIWDITKKGPVDIGSFHPDGTRVVAHVQNTKVGNGIRKLIEIDLATGEASDLLTRVGGASDARWSPDGSMVSFKTMETGEAELHVLDPSSGRTALVSTRPAMAYSWYVDEKDGSLALLYWDFEWSRWRTPIGLAEDGSFVIGEEQSLPWTYDKVRVGAPSLDNQGALYTISPGVEDHDPRHLVVIENWVDSIIEPNGTSSDS